MNKKITGGLTALISALVLLVAVPTAQAGDFVCTTTATGSLDNVVVPAGFTCNMFSAQVKGSVKVYGSLNVFAPTTIEGNIDAEPGHGFLRLFGGAILVKGSVQVKKSTAGIAAGYLSGTQIRGNFQWEENNNALVAFGGTIGGNVKAEKNTGGGFIGPGNTIGGNVECKENTPPIGEGGNNVTNTDRDKCPE